MSRLPKTAEDIALIEARRDGLTFRLLGARFGMTPKTAWNRLSTFGALHPSPRCSMCAHQAEAIEAQRHEIARLRDAYVLLEESFLAFMADQ